MSIAGTAERLLRLWPEEYEAMRAEVAPAIAAYLAASPPPPAPRDGAELLAQGRDAMAAIDAVLIDTEGVEWREIDGVPCRVIATDGPTRAVYLTIHGGGLTFGSARHSDAANLAFSKRHGVAVVSVEYRLAPEHPFPAGGDDCFKVARWLLEGGAAGLGSERLLMGGESAGAYLAALTLLRVRDELGASERFAGANLVFGMYDVGGTPSQRGVRPSNGFDILNPDALEFVRESYTPGMTTDDRRAPAISPMYADLHGLPPALFSVGTADHVLDDNLFMAARWAAAGNAVQLAVYPDCPHGFMALPIGLSRLGLARIDEFIESLLTSDA
jgi:acetyl esterase/lipase